MFLRLLLLLYSSILSFRIPTGAIQHCVVSKPSMFTSTRDFSEPSHVKRITSTLHRTGFADISRSRFGKGTQSAGTLGKSTLIGGHVIPDSNVVGVVHGSPLTDFEIDPATPYTTPSLYTMHRRSIQWIQVIIYWLTCTFIRSSRPCVSEVSIPNISVLLIIPKSYRRTPHLYFTRCKFHLHQGIPIRSTGFAARFANFVPRIFTFSGVTHYAVIYDLGGGYGVETRNSH